MSDIQTRTLSCGATLLVENVPSAASAALTWRLPAGHCCDAPDAIGVTTLLSELIWRGAGDLNSRQLSDALDLLGVQRSSDLSTWHTHISAMMLGSRVAEAMPLLAAVVREPKLPQESLDAVRQLALQSLASLQDDPQHLVMLRLRQEHLPPPFNRTSYGDEQVLQSSTRQQVHDLWQNRFVPRGSIIAAAGDVDADQLQQQLDDLLADWTGVAEEPTREKEPARGVHHIKQETSQVHIGMAMDAPPEPDEHSMIERLAINVLGGGTSGRLFTEVRQKRSLCYSVGASYRPGRDLGMVTIYAGTTPQRADQTLQVINTEIDRLRTDGVQRDEFDRATNRLKSRLVMQGESTAARAAALSLDQFRIGRPRSLEEIADAVDAVSLDDVNAYLRQRDFGPFTVVTVGPEEISPVDVPHAIESSAT